MSDIEEENMLSFHTGIGEISVGGFSRYPNSKIMMSMNNIHTNLNRHRQDPLQYDRSLYHCERELSPMSLRSDFGPQRFNFNKYPSSHRSVLDCRSRSPLSLRSGDSVRSAIDITNALKNESFNMHELQTIKDVVCRKLKHQLRKRYENKRNKSILLKKNNNKVKNIRRQIDSSRESSESPISSNEDCEHSIKNASVFRGPHINRVDKSLLMTSTSNIHPHTDLTMAVQKNMISHKTTNHLGEVMKPDSTNEERILKYIPTKNNSLRSQRLKETITATNKNNFIERHKIIEERESCSSGNEEIFSDHEKRKRSLNDQCIRNAKKIKLSIIKTPIKDVGKDPFKKPLEPKTKPKGKDIKEFVISKATLPPLSGSNQKVKKDSSKQMDVSIIHENSMKTSFSKRKLFTQKVDMLSAKLAGDSARSSPQAKVDNKEKNKARKLVTTQSCLNRNVSDEEDNVLDLIHRIIPAEQMSATSSRIIKTNPGPDEKFRNDVSDTFTDETLNSTICETDSKKNNLHKGDNGYKLRDCSIILHNIDSKNIPRNIFQRSKCVKSFWDTDIESEKESETVPVSKLPNPSEVKGQLKDVTSSTLNTTKHQVSKIGKVLTVQDLINKRNAKKKTLNIELNVTNVKEKATRENTKKVSSDVPQEDNIENINKTQNHQNKLEPVTTTKMKNETVGQSKAVKKNASNKQTGGIKVNLDLNRKQSRRSKSSNRLCSGCEDMTNTARKPYPKSGKTNKSNLITEENEQSARAEFILNHSLNTSDSFNISRRTRSKDRNESVEISKENISQLSDNCNITVLSLRPRKNISKTDTTALNKPR